MSTTIRELQERVLSDAASGVGRLPGRGGQVATRWELTRRLPRDILGDAWKAWDVDARTSVHLHMIPLDQLDNQDLAAREASFRTLAELTHPALVKLLDWGEDWHPSTAPFAFLVHERTPGVPLLRYLEERGSFTPAEAARLLAPVAAALDHACVRGLVHGALHPRFLWINEDGRARLSGLGLATTLGLNLPGSRDSSAYASPEECRGEPATPTSEVWTLGVLAHELLTGQVPFPGAPANRRARILAADPDRPRSAELDEATAAALALLRSGPLRLRPTSRPGCAGDVIEILETAARSPRRARLAHALRGAAHRHGVAELLGEQAHAWLAPTLDRTLLAAAWAADSAAANGAAPTVSRTAALVALVLPFVLACSHGSIRPRTPPPAPVAVTETAPARTPLPGLSLIAKSWVPTSPEEDSPDEDRHSRSASPYFESPLPTLPAVPTKPPCPLASDAGETRPLLAMTSVIEVTAPTAPLSEAPWILERNLKEAYQQRNMGRMLTLVGTREDGAGELASKSRIWLAQLARALLAEGMPGPAARGFHRLVGLEPDAVEPRLLLAASYASMSGMSDRADQTLRTCLAELSTEAVEDAVGVLLGALERSAPRGHDAIIRVLLDRAEREFAMNHAEVAKALALRTLDLGKAATPRVHALLGRLARRRGKTAEALRHWQQALASGRSWERGQPQDTLEAFRARLEKKSAGDAFALLTLARLRRALRAFNRHQFGTSMDELADVVRLFPSGRAALSRYYAASGARVLEEGRHALVLPLLKGALDLDASNSLAHKTLADYYTQVEETHEKALYHYRLALASCKLLPAVRGT